MTNLTRRAFLSLTSGALATGALSAAATLSGCSSESTADSTDATAADSTASSDSGTLTAPLDNGYNTGLHHATIEVENLGAIELELNATNAPITVSNFADLVNQGFYDGLTFHRIIEGFMIQGGDPNGNGTGGSPRTIKGEFSANGVVNAIQHKRGVISMARSSANDSASSQFFIMHADSESLDGNYAAFGKVTSGMDVVDTIATTTPVEDSNGTVAAENQPKIARIVMVD